MKHSTTTNSELEDNLLWDNYNNLLLSPDISRVRKMLVRYDLFKMSLNIPGDIFECGVFKGACLFYWAKLLEIYLPNSIKNVVGFDTFDFFASSVKEYEKQNINQFINESNCASQPVKKLQSMIDQTTFKKKIKLVPGDLTKTAPQFSSSNKGLKISLLHIDVDTFDATQAILKHFYPYVSRGGIIIFDEYSVKGWGETDAADDFFSNKPNVTIQSVPFSEKPTAFIVKP